MVWNVWWRFGDDWRGRENGITTTVDTYRPDLLGLVEAWSGEGTDQPERLAAARGMHSVFASAPHPRVPCESRPGIDSGLGLISRWPILTVERPGPSTLLATVDHPRGPLHVIVARTEASLPQTRSLAGLALDPRLDGPLPVLLLADLNTAPGQAAFEPLGDSMIDTWAEGGGDPRAVTVDSSLRIAPRDAVQLLDRRIDHVLVRPGRPGLSVAVHGAFIAGDRPIGGSYPSDHYAVCADLEP